MRPLLERGCLVRFAKRPRWPRPQDSANCQLLDAFLVVREPPSFIHNVFFLICHKRGLFCFFSLFAFSLSGSPKGGTNRSAKRCISGRPNRSEKQKGICTMGRGNS